MIKDSGERREFDTGAVRDIQVGKGRCDLLPLDIIANCVGTKIFSRINEYQNTGNCKYLCDMLQVCKDTMGWGNWSTMFLELAIHFEEGAIKYSGNNWKKGIPTHCYIDSAIRHYFKYLRGDNDERHDRAFIWNIVCCIWTCEHKPELNDYQKEEIKNRGDKN